MQRVISFDTLLKRFGALATVSMPWTKAAAPVSGPRQPVAASRTRRKRGDSPGWPWVLPAASADRRASPSPAGSLAPVLEEAVALPAERRTQLREPCGPDRRGGLWWPPGRTGGGELPRVPWPLPAASAPRRGVPGPAGGPRPCAEEDGSTLGGEPGPSWRPPGAWEMAAGRPVFLDSPLCSLAQMLISAFLYNNPNFRVKVWIY